MKAPVVKKPVVQPKEKDIDRIRRNVQAQLKKPAGSY